MNKYAIKLEKDKLPPFRFIYSLDSVNLEMLKIYIKINLINNFIQLFKYFTNASILFDQKLYKSHCFYIDYQGFNNFTIKN